MADSPEFLIEGILPAGEAHLIGGASGSGKTTWIFQNFLASWIAGQPVFEHESHPVPYVYISMDRLRSSVTRTLNRLELKDTLTRLICLDEMPNDCLSLPAILQFALTKFPDSKLAIIEGFALIAGEKTNGYTAVGHLMRKTSRLCASTGLTIIGVCHAPKMRVDEGFQHSRELLLGSVSWAAYSDTIIVLNMDELTNVITVKVMPRNAAMETHSLQFGQNGRLEPVVVKFKKGFIQSRIEALTTGTPVTRDTIRAWGKASSISLRTVDAAIAACVENKVLEVIGNGIYERSPVSISPSDPDFDLSVEE